jgi:ribosome-associated protein
MTPPLRHAIRAAQDHKALDMNILDLKGVSSFTDYFVICTGTSTRHTQAISDAVVEELKKAGVRPAHVEGYPKAEWILIDCLNFVVHIFLESARHYYDLERLWKTAKRVEQH